jgi:hypothetical protein
VTNPKPSKGPAITELKKSLSRRMRAFLVPIRLTNSTVCCGVKASILVAFEKEASSDYRGKFLGMMDCGILLQTELGLPRLETRCRDGILRQKSKVARKDST